jgi:Cd2+/Zn2+-exporting ATPase/Cu+-exporting ATPase
MQKTVEVAIQGMDCMECSQHVQYAIQALPGVSSVNVFLTSEKAFIQFNPIQVDLDAIRKAVEGAGYSIPPNSSPSRALRPTPDFTRQVLSLFGVLFGFMLFVIVIGEWLGLFKMITTRIPWPLWLAVILIGGYPVFRNVLRATWKRQVIAHTLMTVGVLAAVLVGEWATAAVVVFLMRAGDYAERFTTEQARRAVKDLTAIAPQMARVERQGAEIEVSASEVLVGETVIVRPGEKVPVDGEVTDGQATLDQAAITGESLPVEVGPGSKVFAATLARLGSIRLRTTHIGPDTTFGRVIKLVEEAESHRADVQRVANKFSAFYLPVVSGVALLTFLIRRDPLSTAAVLVVACSCSFALATPIAMLASIGAGARRGILIKGGKYLEALSRADVVLIDKTGTLTLGQPHITDVAAAGSAPVRLGSQALTPAQNAILHLAASAERYSEHPLAEAVRLAALQCDLPNEQAQDFTIIPGMGVQANIGGAAITVGNRRMMEHMASPDAQFIVSSANPISAYPNHLFESAAELEGQGKTVLFLTRDGKLEGLLAAADTLRPEVPAAIQALRKLGIKHIELLTGDNAQAAQAMLNGAHGSSALNGLKFQANLLPEDKIAVVKAYQAEGHIVVMVGDGVNDAPALAQADVGIAMGAAGTDIAIEAAHIALMREDWSLVPEVLSIARRTMGVVKLNIGFTAVYNLLGLSLAALGFLPPILAAAAQSIPDLGILANSSRLLRQK